jgi:ferric-dicitrate binding protein FerR (iron transport regulator)
VAKDSLHPFIIKTNLISVQVLGTSFNVRSYPEEDVSVAVATGKVNVFEAENGDGSSRILQPHEMLKFERKQRAFTEKSGFDPALVWGWKDQLLVFHDNRIEEILTTISRWYGVEFILNKNPDQNREFTGTFRNPTLKEVLESISYNYQFNYKIADEKITIY